MPSERFLITGALGCIGAWVVADILMEAARDLETGTPTVWGGKAYARPVR